MSEEDILKLYHRTYNQLIKNLKYRDQFGRPLLTDWEIFKPCIQFIAYLRKFGYYSHKHIDDIEDLLYLIRMLNESL